MTELYERRSAYFETLRMRGLKRLELAQVIGVNRQTIYYLSSILGQRRLLSEEQIQHLSAHRRHRGVPDSAVENESALFGFEVAGAKNLNFDGYLFRTADTLGAEMLALFSAEITSTNVQQYLRLLGKVELMLSLLEKPLSTSRRDREKAAAAMQRLVSTITGDINPYAGANPCSLLGSDAFRLLAVLLRQKRKEAAA
jgi:hypothetical protein